jgi:hypothetical protein
MEPPILRQEEGAGAPEQGPPFGIGCHSVHLLKAEGLNPGMIPGDRPDSSLADLQELAAAGNHHMRGQSDTESQESPEGRKGQEI